MTKYKIPTLERKGELGKNLARKWRDLFIPFPFPLSPFFYRVRLAIVSPVLELPST
ncbi:MULTISPECIES: hypothetical protein [unclassified Nostoc]|uniref:hypothetical protein n=1 Tax=unclassified Nostoc TaxID=2593658 RepID=UPI0013D77C15|nr:MULTISPECIES: hypothetical protein [unclassified Nostoc]MBE9000004.1 hypothetical protein [Nostoc sp. LEGE 12447]NEU83029.1 hypothetical protein [Nostoc sp. UIC 10630]